jgi:hypothetical protein
MAITVTRPNYWTITLDSTGTGTVYKFKFVIFATFPSPIGTVQLRQSRNPQAKGHFDIEKLVKTYLKVTHKHENTITGSVDYDSLHLMPQNTTDVGTASTPDIEDYPISKNNNTLMDVTFACYEEYATTPNGEATLQGSPTNVTYPFINYANEWEDEKELDVDLFNFAQQIGLLSNPTFDNTQPQNWTHYPSDGVVLSFPANNRMKMSVLNSGTLNNRIDTEGDEEQIVGVKYKFKYKIESKSDITNFQIWNGSAYIDAPFQLGWNELIYTCQATHHLYLNVFGTTGGEMLFSFTQFEVGGEKGKFLSELPADTTKGNNTSGKIPHLTSYNDYKTLSFFNNDTAPYATIDGWLEYRFFDTEPIFESINGTIFPTNYVGKIEVTNEGNNGGVNPSGADSDDEYLLFAGVGAANVKNIKYPNKGGYQLQEDSNIKYYTIYYADSVSNSVSTGSIVASTVKQGDRCRILSVGTTDFTLYGAANNNVNTIFYSNSGSIAGTGEVEIFSKKQVSQTHLFEIATDTNCNSTRFEEYSLAWKNKYGTWDYYMFDGEHTDVRNYKRETDYSRLAGGWSDATFTIDSFERGKVQKVNGTKQTTINTRYITDEYNDYFNGLLMSNEVLLLSPVKKGDDDIKQVPIPINIQDKSLTFKTNLKDKLVQYSFTFEYAHDLKQRV